MQIFPTPWSPWRRRTTRIGHYQRAWARTGGIVRLPAGHAVRLFLTAGTAEDSDALSGFRLGSALPFRSEFPLVLHDYYFA